MGMIRQKCPSIALGRGFRKERRQPFKEIFAVLIIIEYLPPFYSPDHDVMHEAGSVQSCCSRHGWLIPASTPKVKLF